MLRNEVQSRTGLTRKAIEYYEEKGFIKPTKSLNGYRNYSEEDLRILAKISQLRKIGLTISEIENFLCLGDNVLASVLRKKQYQLEFESRRKSILEMIVKGDEDELINQKLDLIEKEENIYTKLERAFPGYFGQMLFISYQPFLNEPLREEGEEAYEEYVRFLDDLPPFQLSPEEREYIEKVSVSIDLEHIKEANRNKISAIENLEKWWKENEEILKQYEEFKNSKEYLETPMEGIKNKFYEFMKEHHYYEVAIPLIRKFSKSYDEYYVRLLEAGDKYVAMREGAKDGSGDRH